MEREKYAILAIDDEESIRRLLRKELTTNHREVFTAADAASSLKVVITPILISFPDPKGCAPPELACQVAVKPGPPVAHQLATSLKRSTSRLPWAVAASIR